MRWLLAFCLASSAIQVAGAAQETSPSTVVVSVVIVQDHFMINGITVRLGDVIDAWKGALGGSPRCRRLVPRTCTWDDLGIQVDTFQDAPRRVSGVLVQVNVETPTAGSQASTTPDGAPAPPSESFAPRNAFPGLLLLDGNAIESSTSFRQIKTRVDPARKLRCGFRDCSHPSGRFGDRGSILLRLDGPTDAAEVLDLVVSAGEFRGSGRR